MKTFAKYIAIVCSLVITYTSAYAQSQIKGTVADKETGLPLAGASVFVTDTTTGTTTDANGTFEITVPSGNTQLNVSLLGYTSKTVQLKDGNDNINILLEPSVLLLNDVVIESFQSDKKILNSTSSVGVLTEKDFQRNNNIFLQNSLNTIPGVRMNMRSGTSQSNILIRGIGTYSRFSIRGIKMYLNGIPLSDADGTTSIDDIDNTVLGRAEVIKGPASSIYGATLGGVVHFQTQKAPYQTRSINQSLTVGSFGLFRTNTGISVGTNKVNLLLNYGHQELQGYRQHSNSKKDFVTVAGDFHLSPRQTVSILFNYSKINDKYAGELLGTQVSQDPSQANQNYIIKSIGLNQTSTRLGISHTYHFNSKISNTTSVFTSGINSVSPVEPSTSVVNKNKYGARSVFTFTPTIGGLKTRFHAGSEFIYNDNLTRKYFWSKLNTDSTVQSDIEVRASQLNLFAQGEVDITKKTTLTLGASYNMINYTIVDRLVSTNPLKPHTDLSGNMNFTPVVTPRVAVVHTFSEKVAVYGNVSTGFSPPTSDQISLATGAINTGLKAEKNTSYELGTRGTIIKNRLTYGLSAFSMSLNNLLVPTTVSGFTQYNNASKSRNNGVEMNVSYIAFSDTIGFVRLIRPFVTYTHNDFIFKNFVKAGVDYSGNKVTGVFPNLASAGIDVNLKFGIYLNGTYFFNDKMPLQDNNQVSYKSYHLFNVRAGIRGIAFKHFQYDLFGGIENLTNVNYSASLALNGGPAFFSPALPRNYYGGLSLKYLF
jgi:iron complex outermembrane receptor protein